MRRTPRRGSRRIPSGGGRSCGRPRRRRARGSGSRPWCGSCGATRSRLPSCLAPARAGRLSVGQPAPAFVVPGLDGGMLALAQYAGRPRVVTSFATSCGECLGDLAVLEPAYRQYRARGLVVLGIGVEDAASNLRQAARQFGVSFPVGYDEDGTRVALPYGLSSIPTTVFIDAGGTVRDVVRGPVRGAALGRALALILPSAAP